MSKHDKPPADDKAASNADFFPINIWDRILLDNWHSVTREKLPKGFPRRTGKSIKEDLKTIKDCNFTVSGFVSVKELPRCAKLGLKVFVYGDDDETKIGKGEPDDSLQRWKDWWSTHPKDQAIKERIQQLLETTAPYGDTVQGLFLHDEPAASVFPKLRVAVDYVRVHRPGLKPYIELYPNYAQGTQLSGSQDPIDYQTYLNSFENEVNPTFLSYDDYAVEAPTFAPTADYYSNLMRVREIATKKEIPFWSTVASNRIWPGQTNATIPSPADLSLQAYTLLAAGARGITWFNYFSDHPYVPLNLDGRKTLTWYYLQEINRQVKTIGPTMNRLTSTGVYFYSPELIDGSFTPPQKNTSGEVVESIKTINVNAPMMVGEFKHEDNSRYAMIVNLSLEKSVAFRMTPKIPGPIHVISAADGKPFDFRKQLEECDYWLVAGQGVLLKFG